MQAYSQIFVDGSYDIPENDVRRVATLLHIPIDVIRYCILPRIHSVDWDIMQMAFGGHIRWPYALGTRAVELDSIPLVRLARECGVLDKPMYDYAVNIGSTRTIELLHYGTASRRENIRDCIKCGYTEAVKILCSICSHDWVQLASEAVEHNQFDIFKWFITKTQSSDIIDVIIRYNRIDMMRCALSRIPVNMTHLRIADAHRKTEIAEMLRKHLATKYTYATQHDAVQSAFMTYNRHISEQLASYAYMSTQRRVSRHPRKR